MSEEAKELGLKPPEVEPGPDGQVVVLFPTAPVRRPRPQGLTAGEIEQLRQMLREFERVKLGCPIARKAVQD